MDFVYSLGRTSYAKKLMYRCRDKAFQLLGAYVVVPSAYQEALAQLLREIIKYKLFKIELNCSLHLWHIYC